MAVLAARIRRGRACARNAPSAPGSELRGGPAPWQQAGAIRSAVTARSGIRPRRPPPAAGACRAGRSPARQEPGQRERGTRSPHPRATPGRTRPGRADARRPPACRPASPSSTPGAAPPRLTAARHAGGSPRPPPRSLPPACSLLTWPRQRPGLQHGADPRAWSTACRPAPAGGVETGRPGEPRGRPGPPGREHSGLHSAHRRDDLAGSCAGGRRRTGCQCRAASAVAPAAVTARRLSRAIASV
jgi:hypothetical protein